MVKIFYGNRLYALYIIPVIVATFVILNYYVPYHVPEEITRFGFWGDLIPQTSTFSMILAPSLIVLNAVLLNNTFNKHDFLGRNRYITALLYITALSYFHTFYFLDGFSIAQVFVILALRQTFKLNQNEDGRKTVFNVSFLLGVASTFYPLLLISIPFVFWIIWILRPFVLRESILTLIGFIVPLVYTGVYQMYFEYNMDTADFSSNASELKLFDIAILGGLMFLLGLFSIKTYLLRLKVASIRLRKLFSIILMLFLFTIGFSVLSYFLFNKKEALALIFIPAVFILTYSFGFKTQRLVPTLTFYLIFLFSVGKFFVSLNH